MHLYNRTDGVKAFALYLIDIGITCLLEGLPPLTGVSVGVINGLKILNAVLGIAICIGFALREKRNISSLGVHAENLGISILYGLLGAFALLVVQWGVMAATAEVHVAMSFLQPVSVLLFVPAALREELVFRGYMQSRLHGLIPKEWGVLLLTAVLFLLGHYPIMLMYGTLVPVNRVVWLVLLSLVCGLVYRKTDNLWGAVLVHMAYNLVGIS